MLFIRVEILKHLHKALLLNKNVQIYPTHIETKFLGKVFKLSAIKCLFYDIDILRHAVI